jgi:triosephosphate isomerase
MPLARPVVLGNWKMNGLRADGLTLAGRLAAPAAHPSGPLGVGTPATPLATVAQRLERQPHHGGWADCHEAESAPIPLVIAAMLRMPVPTAVILGHSEPPPLAG